MFVCDSVQFGEDTPSYGGALQQFTSQFKGIIIKYGVTKIVLKNLTYFTNVVGLKLINKSTEQQLIRIVVSLSFGELADHSNTLNVRLLYFLISNSSCYSVVLLLLFTDHNYYNTFLFKGQLLDSSNQSQTVQQANVMSCAIHIRPKCDCAPNYLAYFPSRLSRLTKTFSTLILTDYS